jgi:hypothetical protein
MSVSPELSSVVDELYGLPPGEFIAARNAAAKGSDLAATIKKLPKPTSSAWVVNMLLRHRSEEFAQLLDLGDELRSAQADLDAGELRSLGKQRAQLVSAVARDGRAVAKGLGHIVGEAVIREVEQTLQAAMVDATAADAVRSGCLLRPIEADGVSPADLTGATAIEGGAPHKARAAPAAPDRSERRRREARARLDEAQDRAEDAEAELDDAQSAVDEQAAPRRSLEAAIDDLEHKLGEAQRALSAHDRQTRVLERERDAAAKAEERARDAVVRAKAALDRLS